MKAGKATLDALKNGKSIYSKLDGLGEKTRKQLAKALLGNAVVTGKGSLFMTHFTKENMEIKNAADAARCNSKMLQRFHFEMIVKDGVFFLPGKLGAFSNAHSDSDVKTLVRSAERFAQGL